MNICRHMNLTHFTDVAVDDGSLCLPDVFFQYDRDDI